MGQEGFGNATLVFCNSTCLNNTRQNGTEKNAPTDDNHFLFLRNVMLGSVGVVLNIIAIVFLAINRKMKGCIKVALLSMSVNDLIFSTDAIGFGIPQTTEHPACWPIIYVIITTLLLSCYNTVLLSAQNYIAVFHPFHCNIILTTWRVVLSVIGGWLAGYLLTLAALDINLPAGLECFAIAVMPEYGIRLVCILCFTFLIVSIVVNAKIMFKVLRTRKIACGQIGISDSAVPQQSLKPSVPLSDEYLYPGTQGLPPLPRAWSLTSRLKQKKRHMNVDSRRGNNLSNLDVLTLVKHEGKGFSPLTFMKRKERQKEKVQSFHRNQHQAEINTTGSYRKQFHEPTENSMLKDGVTATNTDKTAEGFRIYKGARISEVQNRLSNSDPEDSGYQHYDTDSVHTLQIKKSSPILKPHCYDKNTQIENHNIQHIQPLKMTNFSTPSQVNVHSKRSSTLTTICEANIESNNPGPSRLFHCGETSETAGQAFVVNEGKYRIKQKRFYTRPHSRPVHLPLSSTSQTPGQLLTTLQATRARSGTTSAVSQQNDDAVEEESSTPSSDSHVRMSPSRRRQKDNRGKIWTAAEAGEGSSGTSRKSQSRDSSTIIPQPQRQKRVVLRNTLIILSIWTCLFSFPYILYTTYVAMLGGDGKAREKFSKSKFGVFVSSLVGISGITHPILYAWRFIEWKMIYRRVKQKIVGR